LLKGRPGPIIRIGLALMAWGFCTTYLLIATAYGGFLYAPTVVQIVGFGLTGGSFLSGVVLVMFGGYRRCRSLCTS
jgi:hypothetical protein